MAPLMSVARNFFMGREPRRKLLGSFHVMDHELAAGTAIEKLAEMGIKTAPVCDATTFLRRASLDLTGEIPGPEEVIEFYKAGKYAEALPVAERYVSRVRQRRGEEHAEYAGAISWQGLLLQHINRLAEAEPLTRRSSHMSRTVSSAPAIAHPIHCRRVVRRTRSSLLFTPP